MANSALARDRAAVEAGKKQLVGREQLAQKLANDQGFQDSLALYKSMPAKQVKQVFLSMDDQTVQRYLQAMEPRGAAKIVREFKTPDEVKRIQKILDQMRGAGGPVPATDDAAPAEAPAQAADAEGQ
jgi:hypothetical protein